MIAQVVLSPECLVANITSVGSLIGVSSFMNQKIVGFGELALAEAANEFCSVMMIVYRRAK